MTEIRIRIITPVFIGKGEEITPFEYIMDGDRLVIFDSYKYFRDNPDKVDKFYEKVNFSGKGFFLDDFLRENKKDRKYWKYSVKSSSFLNSHLRTLIKKGSSDMAVKSHIKDEIDHRAYIPGSSLKGAIRTAFLYNSLIGKKNSVVGQLSKSLDSWNRTDFGGKKYEAGKIKRIFSSFFKSSFTADMSPVKNNDAQNDIFRFLKVSDSTGKKNCFELNLMDSYSFNYYKDYKTVYETISAESKFKTEINIERDIFQENFRNIIKWNNSEKLTLSSIFKMINKFSLDILNYELNYFKKLNGNYPEKSEKYCQILKGHIEKAGEDKAYISIGQGSGWHKMTIGILIKEWIGEEYFKFLRDALNLAPRRLDFDFPKSRKLIVKYPPKDIEIPAGWIQLSKKS